MKKAYIFFILILMFMLAACQPTPQEPIVQSKNDGKLEKALESTPQEIKNYILPESMKAEYKNGIITVKIDAGISMPTSKYFPVYRVYRERLSESHVNQIVKYFIGGEKLYTADSIYPSENSSQLTKADLKKKIDAATESLNKLLDKSSTEYKDLYEKGGDAYVERIIKELQNTITDYSKQYKTAPDDLTRVEIEKIWTYNDESDTELTKKYYGINAATENGEKSISYHADTDLFGKQTIAFNDLSIRRIYASDAKEVSLQDIDGAKYTYEESVELAQKLLNDFGIKNFGILTSTMYLSYKTCGIGRDRAEIYENKAPVYMYSFTFTPSVGTLPITTYGHIETRASVQAQKAAPVWETPRISIAVDPNYGVVSFAEVGFIKFGDCINEGVEILSFDEIEDITARFIALSPMIPYVAEDDKANPAPTNRTVYISDIKLNYIKIYEKDNLDAGLTIPAWCFYGTYTDEYADGQVKKPDHITAQKLETTPIFCVNAIDGSIIDPTQGY